MSKKSFLAEIWPKTAIFAETGNFFFEKIFFAQFSKLSHFEHKNAKKINFQVIFPFIVTRILPQKIFQKFSSFFIKNCFCSIRSTPNGLKWLSMIIFMFCFIPSSVKWPEKVWFSWNLAKNGQKSGKICKNQGFWHFEQNWVSSFDWKWL